MNNVRVTTLATAMLLCITASRPVDAQTPSSPPPVPVNNSPARTALYFQFGQSNAVGMAPLGQVPKSLEAAIKPGTIQELELFEGSGESAKYRLRNLHYLRGPSDKATDSIEGVIAGPRAETVIDVDTNASNVAVSSFAGVAEKISEGYNSAASRVVLLKVARGATLLVGQDPNAVPVQGGVYKNGRRAITRWLRGFVNTEVKAGRRVDLQMVELMQGEREAALARMSNNPLHPEMQGWATRLLTSIYPYYTEKFGVSFPLMVRQLQPIRIANAPGAELERYTDIQNQIEESVCRYTVTIDDNGNIRSVTDNGASPNRIPTAYFLKHNRTTPNVADVHADYALSRVFGIAKVNLQKYLETGDQGLTRFSIKRIAPVIMSYSVGDATTTTLTVNMFIDETAKIHMLAVPANARRPAVWQIKTLGSTSISTVDINGNGWRQAFTVTGLKPQTAYDVYAVATDLKFGHTGSVFKVVTNFSTKPL